ncbi:unnamed protein product [Prunus armeniaca]|uniref:Uncharacterized protein n=2 Tax=Prunus armeniaca TaxID=36596 RepID=A0A6J5UZ28_PRUAR|nr:unnamed protein product [Prunus armeniaca]CAB4281191.1 unnamed protein product [Prunus armeniaca]CAB4311601.1 unnamed protein product [Prunus armeniaca]
MFDYCNVMSSRSDAKSGPFLQEEIMSLKGLELLTQHAEHVESAPETIPEASPPVFQEKKPAEKKPVKPKWGSSRAGMKSSRVWSHVGSCQQIENKCFQLGISFKEIFFLSTTGG